MHVGAGGRGERETDPGVAKEEGPQRGRGRKSDELLDCGFIKKKIRDFYAKCA